ncbi:MAG: hypothetical protein DVB22_002074 [Verrucomicrobia bacterium]|nr:MAG: hypothetical protein DVB22_002074 [Verrucomicrobiota bacterium]
MFTMRRAICALRQARWFMPSVVLMSSKFSSICQASAKDGGKGVGRIAHGVPQGCHEDHLPHAFPGKGGGAPDHAHFKGVRQSGVLLH